MNSFDAAFSMFGLIFYSDRARGLQELRRVVRPGAPVVVSSWHPMDTIPEFKERILKEILAPNSGWSAEWIAHMRTKLNLPAPVPPPKP